MAKLTFYTVLLVALCFVLVSECRSTVRKEENEFLKALENVSDQRKKTEGEESNKADQRRDIDESAGPRRGRDEIEGPRRGRDEISGPRRGRDEISGPRRGRDEISGPRRGRDEIYGPRRGRDEIFGPRRGRDEIFGPRRGRDEIYGPRRGRDEISGPRRGREVKMGPRRGRSDITKGSSDGPRRGREVNSRQRRSIDLYHVAPRLGRNVDFGYSLDDEKHREMRKLQSLDENNFRGRYYDVNDDGDGYEDSVGSFNGESDNEMFLRSNMIGQRRRNYDNFEFEVGDFDFNGID